MFIGRTAVIKSALTLLNASLLIKQFLENNGDDQMTVITNEDNKYFGKYQAHRQIYTKSVIKLHKQYLKEHPDCFTSFSTFYRLKPLYI